MKVTGVINKILYNKDSYYLFSLECENAIPEDKRNPQYPHSITVSGNFAEIFEGNRLEINGDWSYRSNSGKYHPWTFKAISYELINTNTPAEIVRIISKAPGVSDHQAWQIYFEFRTEAINTICSENYNIITSVCGVSPEIAEALHEYMVKYQAENHLKIFLAPYSVPDSKLNAIKCKWGDPVAEIKNNPYILVNEDILGFKISDRIAKDMEFSVYDRERMCAAIRYVLKNVAYSQGHSYLPKDELISAIGRFLNSNEVAMRNQSAIYDLHEQIDFLISEKLLINDKNDIYLPERYQRELRVAEIFLRRTKQDSLFSDASDEQINKCILRAEETIGVSLADKQKEAALLAAKSQTLVITGGPGMGKTTCLKAILLTLDYLAQELNMKERDKTLAAPSGMAAKRIQESSGYDAFTIHRMLQLIPGKDGKVKCKDEKDPLNTDIVVIDETSMIDIDLMYHIVSAIRDTTMLILVGDIDQLPSVGPGNVLRDVIDSASLPVVRLNRTYRQGAESAILSNAHLINEGNCNLELNQKDFVFIEIPDDTDSNGNRLAETVQRVFYEEYIERGEDVGKIQVLCPMRHSSDHIKTTAVVDELNPLLQNTINPTSDIEFQIKYGNCTFRKGDKVMQLSNNYEKNVFNGDVGIIEKVSPKNNKILVNYQGLKVEYIKDELDQVQHSFVTTIHKAQGGEYDCIIIPITMQHRVMLQRNLIYTAVTRAKKKVYVIGDWNALMFAIRNISNSRRYSKLKQRLRKG